MDMKIIKKEKLFCTCCMEEHEVKTVVIKEQTTFKNTKVEYEAIYFYCDVADEFYMDEQQIQENDIRMKNSYRKSDGLLTSTEISEIRTKYGVSQRDFCILLGWGGKTITRYEGHQIQDKAHDSILKKLDQDPEWFISLLNDAKRSFSVEVYQKYLYAANALYEKNQDAYLRKAIESKYVKFCDNPIFHGNTELSLDKTIDVIRYYASSKRVTDLYKVKLMKLMWYADALSYKKRGAAISGLVYQALPMGAVPIAHDSIIVLRGVPCEEVDMGETIAYHFALNDENDFPHLDEREITILDEVIDKLGTMKKTEIVNFMHKEQAYIKTSPGGIISFEYAKNLQI